MAGQMEAARKTQFAKDEVGIKDSRSRTLTHFMHASFIPFLEATKSSEPNTVKFYKACVRNLLACPNLADSKLDQITAETIATFIAQRQDAGMSIATINRELATLRRALRLASEWGDLLTTLPKFTPLDGEVCRERVLTQFEEDAYLKAAEPLLRTVATIMLDCGLRPDEVYRLKWHENYRDGKIVIHTGKTKAARRSIPVSRHGGVRLKAWRNETNSEGNGWIFPARTKTGHIDQSTLKKAHRRALRASEVTPFVLYDLRHTCLTRWAKYLDPFTLKKLAGHESLETTMKYIHLNESESEARLKDTRDKFTQDAIDEILNLGMDEGERWA